MVELMGEKRVGGGRGAGGEEEPQASISPQQTTRNCVEKLRVLPLKIYGSTGYKRWKKGVALCPIAALTQQLLLNVLLLGIYCPKEALNIVQRAVYSKV